MTCQPLSSTSFRALVLLGGAVVFAAGCAQTNWEPPVAPLDAYGPTDMVHVGYAVTPARDITGAISSIKTSEFTGQHFASVADMLRFRVPGVQVTRNANGFSSIRIRGTRSFVGTNEPLILVDGVPFGVAVGALDSLDPATVERIDVLKDGGSTAAYGSRGANGVILITTKR